MKIVCFAPNDAVWLWTFPQAQVLEALQRRGDEIVYVHCDREFSSFCMSMASSRVSFADSPAQKEAICAQCVANSALVRKKLQFTSRAIGSFLSDEDRAIAESLSRNSSVQELTEVTVAGVPVGRLAIFEAIIQSKSAKREISGDTEQLYRVNFRNTYLAALASDRLIEQLRPDIGLSYHTAYAYNRAFQMLLERSGIPVWFLNASLNVSETATHLVITKSDPERFFAGLLADWDQFRAVPCTPTDIESAGDHLITLMGGGGFGYSNAITARSRSALEVLNCKAGKKVLLAALSSYDEMLAAELSGFGWSLTNPLFESQIKWIEWLFGFAAARPDIQLIVRAHPREFVTNGPSMVSEHAQMLAELFDKRPENVAINLPSDGVSLYELLTHTDAVLVAWSSAGVDAGLLGIPGVSYCEDVLLYPKELIYCATDKARYAAQIDKALQSGWSFERSRLFFRWIVASTCRTRVDLTNGAKTAIRLGRIGHFARRAVRRALRSISGVSREELDIALRPRTLYCRQQIFDQLDHGLDHLYDVAQSELETSPELEEIAIRRQLMRVAAYIKDRGAGDATRLLGIATEPASIAANRNPKWLQQ